MPTARACLPSSHPGTSLARRQPRRRRATHAPPETAEFGYLATGQLPLRYPHGPQRSRCKECGGGGLCEHGRQRGQCKECGSSSICLRARAGAQAGGARKECAGSAAAGSGICEHGRHRYYCKDCGGGGICEHGRRRRKCKQGMRRGKQEAVLLKATVGGRTNEVDEQRCVAPRVGTTNDTCRAARRRLDCVAALARKNPPLTLKKNHPNFPRCDPSVLVPRCAAGLMLC